MPSRTLDACSGWVSHGVTLFSRDPSESTNQLLDRPTYQGFINSIDSRSEVCNVSFVPRHGRTVWVLAPLTNAQPVSCIREMFKQHWSHRSKQSTYDVFWRHQGRSYLNSSRTRSIGQTPNNCSIGNVNLDLLTWTHTCFWGKKIWNNLRLTASVPNSLTHRVKLFTAIPLKSLCMSGKIQPCYPQMSRLQAINKIFSAFKGRLHTFTALGRQQKYFATRKTWSASDACAWSLRPKPFASLGKQTHPESFGTLQFVTLSHLSISM